MSNSDKKINQVDYWKEVRKGAKMPPLPDEVINADIYLWNEGFGIIPPAAICTELPESMTKLYLTKCSAASNILKDIIDNKQNILNEKTREYLQKIVNSIDIVSKFMATNCQKYPDNSKDTDNLIRVNQGIDTLIRLKKITNKSDIEQAFFNEAKRNEIFKSIDDCNNFNIEYCNYLRSNFYENKGVQAYIDNLQNEIQNLENTKQYIIKNSKA